MKKTLEIPYFPGFYDSIFDLLYVEREAIYEDIESHKYENNEELDPDKYEFDHKTYMKDVCVAFCENYFDRFRLPFMKSVEYSHLSSPREYNFETDRLYADFELADSWQEDIRHFMASHWDELKEKIHKEWSSRDGFWSFISNNIEDWPRYMFEVEDERYISEMIKYMTICLSGQSFEDIMSEISGYVMEDVYEGFYLTYNETVD